MKRQRLGQHYLVDLDVVRSIVEAAEIKHDERVLEIGTGRGVLTRELVGLGATFEGYEVDPENCDATTGGVKGAEGKLHLRDAFASEPEFDVLVSSLPYSESARFVDWLARTSFRRAVVLLQADFVRKILAPPGARDYRAVSAISQISTDVRVLKHVPREAFAPQPKVASALVSILPKRTMTRPQIDKVKKLFTLRRRKASAVSKELGVSLPVGLGERRVYSLTPEEVWEACRA